MEWKFNLWISISSLFLVTGAVSCYSRFQEDLLISQTEELFSVPLDLKYWWQLLLSAVTVFFIVLCRKHKVFFRLREKCCSIFSKSSKISNYSILISDTDETLHWERKLQLFSCNLIIDVKFKNCMALRIKWKIIILIFLSVCCHILGMSYCWRVITSNTINFLRRATSILLTFPLFQPLFRFIGMLFFWTYGRLRKQLI